MGECLSVIDIGSLARFNCSLMGSQGPKGGDVSFDSSRQNFRTNGINPLGDESPITTLRLEQIMSVKIIPKTSKLLFVAQHKWILIGRTY